MYEPRMMANKIYKTIRMIYPLPFCLGLHSTVVVVLLELLQDI
jgi:hypothetical protein